MGSRRGYRLEARSGAGNKVMMKKMDRWIRDINHRRIDLMRAFVLEVCRVFFNFFHRHNVEDGVQNSLLVFRLDDKIGDSVTATGFLRGLKESFPQSRLIVLSRRNAAFVYEGLAFIDEVLVVKKGFWSTLQTYRKLSQQTYRFIFNTSHILNPQVVVLVSLLRAFRRLTFLNENFEMFTDHVTYNQWQDHITERYRQIFKKIGLTVVNLDYCLTLTEDPVVGQIREWFQTLRQRYGSVVVLNSFAGARLRNFNEETTQNIVLGLLKVSANMVVVSVGSADDLPKAQKWIQKASDSRWICFPQAKSLRANCEMILQSDLVITPDTSFVHICSALKKPVVAVYRQDEAQEKNSMIWAPYRTRHAILYAPVDRQRPDDINTVDVDQVVRKATELLAVNP